MKQLTLCLAFHNHQPVGNFPWVFEEAYRQSYLPMIESLERHPQIRVSLHYTGPLLDWIRDNHPEFLRRVASLVGRQQVEMMTGGYYEPILPSIPVRDQIGQINKLTDYVARVFSSHATGLWLAERVWEPSLPSTLRAAGVDWTIVDDTHFKMVGLEDSDLTGYFLTEDQGATLKIFATSKRLRYVIPWAPVEQVISELNAMAGDDPSLVAVMGDDGEKFGSWPGTYDHCWTYGWIDRFYDAVAANASWIKMVPVGEYARNHGARGRIYLPTASYAEMLEWALPVVASSEYSRIVHEMEAANRPDVVRFLRGGFWRNFLVKYEEVNTLHKKMLRAHRKAYDAATGASAPDSIALDELWQGQCNCPYWHGVFGGTYMTDVRTANFRHLIRSESRSDALLHGAEPWIAHEVVDFDLDSRDEVIVESGAASYCLSPAAGGTLVEWDARRNAHNLLSVMTRRPEPYHLALRQAAESQTASDSGQTKTIHEIVRLKEAGLEKLLHYDWYRRTALIDHFLRHGTPLDAFASCAYDEDGDFVNQPYRFEVSELPGGRTITFARDGHVWSGPNLLPVNVTKTLTFKNDEAGFAAQYRVTNQSAERLATTFGVELNLNLLGGGGNPAAFVRFGSSGEEQRFDQRYEGDDVRQLTAGNRWLDLALDLSAEPPARVWWTSIDSVSSSEGGFERVHQGAVLLLSWQLELPPGGQWTTEARATVR
jgi:alpha-amylase